MICITMAPHVFEVKMQGHAGAERNAEGHDLVCCAASVLLQTLVYWAQDVKMAKADGSIAKGDAYVRLTPYTDCYDQTWAAYSVMRSGMEMLQKAYPECINIEYK